MIKGALKPLTPDPRDFSHTKVFGSIKPAQLPTDDFWVGTPIETTNNQDINYPSDFCTIYGSAELREIDEGIPFVPEYTFAQMKRQAMLKARNEQERQEILNSFGTDLRSAALAACEAGFLPRANDPFKCDTFQRPQRNFIVDYRNWPDNLRLVAQNHAPESFFFVDGPYDLFDNIRSVLWQNKQAGIKQGVLTGANWYESWSSVKDGFIDVDTYNTSESFSAHAFDFLGQSTQHGKLCLIAQLSNGKLFGAEDIFYFTREVVNKEFVYGNIVFKDMLKGDAKWHNDNNINVNQNEIIKIFKTVFNAIVSLFK